MDDKNLLKKCSKCGIEKEYKNFSKNKRNKNGLQPKCKECNKKYRESNRNKIALYAKDYYNKNEEKLKEYIKNYYNNNKDNIKNYSNEYYLNNKERQRENKRLHKKAKRKTDNFFRLKDNIKSSIYTSFKNKTLKKNAKTTQILGCTYEELEQHLIMSVIKNYGIYLEDLRNGNCDPELQYEIDHIIPLSSAKTEEDIIKLNHYTNLQWLTRKDNRIKRDRLDWSIL